MADEVENAGKPAQEPREWFAIGAGLVAHPLCVGRVIIRKDKGNSALTLVENVKLMDVSPGGDGSVWKLVSLDA